MKILLAAHDATTQPQLHLTTMATITLRIENMHCGSCIRRVTQTLNGLPNTHAEEVRVGSARLTTTAAPDEIQQALASAGYPTLVESNAL